MITERYGINMKINWKSLYQKEHFVKRLITVIVAVIVMGFALSWLVLVDMGTDPCTLMNRRFPHDWVFRLKLAGAV